MRQFVTLRGFATFVIILFCIQYIPVESRGGVSWIKTIVSGICLAVLLSTRPKMSLVTACSIFYFLCSFLFAYFNFQSFRSSTFLYFGTLLIAFITIHHLVVERQVFSYQYFIKFIKSFILCYTVVLVLQQLLIILGIRSFPFLNLVQFVDRGIGANSLSYEPSTAARTIGTLFYIYLKCNEYVLERHLTISELFQDNHKWPTIGFLWSMCTMGSGTAFIYLACIILYFINRSNIKYLLPLLLALILVLPYVGNKSLDRAINAAKVTATGSAEDIVETDSSAAVRILPIVNTFTNLDLTDPKTWLGHGIDYSLSHKKDRYLGNILDYGLISYLLGLLLVCLCCYSTPLDFLLMILGLGGGVWGNIPYAWGLSFLFICKYYFSKQKQITADETITFIKLD